MMINRYKQKYLKVKKENEILKKENDEIMYIVGGINKVFEDYNKEYRGINELVADIRYKH